MFGLILTLDVFKFMTNADRNASRNIAKSINYIDKKEQSKYFKYINK